METTKEKVSYCIGLQTGLSLKERFADMETDLLKRGFLDALEGTPPKLTQDEIVSIMQSLQQQMEQQQKAFIAQLAENNRAEGESFLEANKRKEGVVTLSSGLQYKILQKGSGAKPSLTDVVSVHYRGTFLDGQVFDSSYERGKPQVFPVNRVIPGWSQALQLMQVGGKLQIFIPHYLAYGEAGFGEDIPPCTTLVFEMELLGIEQGH